MHRVTALHHLELEPSEKEAELLKHAARHSGDPLYFRGVPTLPAEVTFLGEDSQVLCRPGALGAFIAVGDVYTDGALTGRFQVLKRAGWAIAVPRQDLGIEWAAY